MFGVADHRNAEALGCNVTKHGDRYAAAEAAAMAVKRIFGHVSASAARGLALRHDHGSAFMAERFPNQIRFRVMAPSYTFVGEPETNGVAERFFRTVEERIIHGRIYQTINEVRATVRDFIARYGASWLIEKSGFLSPNDARSASNQTTIRRAAYSPLVSKRLGAVQKQQETHKYPTNAITGESR